MFTFFDNFFGCRTCACNSDAENEYQLVCDSTLRGRELKDRNVDDAAKNSGCGLENTKSGNDEDCENDQTGPNTLPLNKRRLDQEACRKGNTLGLNDPKGVGGAGNSNNEELIGPAKDVYDKIKSEIKGLDEDIVSFCFSKFSSDFWKSLNNNDAKISLFSDFLTLCVPKWKNKIPISRENDQRKWETRLNEIASNKIKRFENCIALSNSLKKVDEESLGILYRFADCLGELFPDELEDWLKFYKGVPGESYLNEIVTKAPRCDNNAKIDGYLAKKIKSVLLTIRETKRESCLDDDEKPANEVDWQGSFGNMIEIDQSNVKGQGLSNVHGSVFTFRGKASVEENGNGQTSSPANDETAKNGLLDTQNWQEEVKSRIETAKKLNEYCLTKDEKKNEEEIPRAYSSKHNPSSHVCNKSEVISADGKGTKSDQKDDIGGGSNKKDVVIPQPDSSKDNPTSHVDKKSEAILAGGKDTKSEQKNEIVAGFKEKGVVIPQTDSGSKDKSKINGLGHVQDSEYWNYRDKNEWHQLKCALQFVEDFNANSEDCPGYPDPNDNRDAKCYWDGDVLTNFRIVKHHVGRSTENTTHDRENFYTLVIRCAEKLLGEFHCESNERERYDVIGKVLFGSDGAGCINSDGSFKRSDFLRKQLNFAAICEKLQQLNDIISEAAVKFVEYEGPLKINLGGENGFSVDYVLPSQSTKLMPKSGLQSKSPVLPSKSVLQSKSVSQSKSPDLLPKSGFQSKSELRTELDKLPGCDHMKNLGAVFSAMGTTSEKCNNLFENIELRGPTNPKGLLIDDEWKGDGAERYVKVNNQWLNECGYSGVTRGTGYQNLCPVAAALPAASHAQGIVIRCVLAKVLAKLMCVDGLKSSILGNDQSDLLRKKLKELPDIVKTSTMLNTVCNATNAEIEKIDSELNVYAENVFDRIRAKNNKDTVTRITSLIFTPEEVPDNGLSPEHIQNSNLYRELVEWNTLRATQLYQLIGLCFGIRVVSLSFPNEPKYRSDIKKSLNRFDPMGEFNAVAPSETTVHVFKLTGADHYVPFARYVSEVKGQINQRA